MDMTSGPFPDGHFEPETLALLTRVFKEAWAELSVSKDLNGSTDMMRELVATRIMIAASQGERDQVKLKGIALGAVGLPLNS